MPGCQEMMPGGDARRWFQEATPGAKVGGRALEGEKEETYYY